MAHVVVGIDEVGRGCWAGPLVAAAVVLQKPIVGLTDSKLLNRRKREELANLIYEHGEVGIGWVNAREVDEVGLTLSVTKAMQAAISQLTGIYDEIIIDGNYNYLPDYPMASALIRADNTVPAVSAASIVAKVARDKYMLEMSAIFPEYQFDKHVGYGTRRHSAMLQQFGICELHRHSFKPIKAYL